MVAGLDGLEPHPQHLFLVGSGVDIAALKPQLEAVTSIPVSAPEEPETALAWGAALASASAPLFVSSTAALAYAQDPATGEVDPYAVSPGYLAVPDVPPGTELGEDDLAYSAVPDEEAEANTAALDEEAEANTTALDLAGDEIASAGRFCSSAPCWRSPLLPRLGAGGLAGTRYPAECCRLIAWPLQNFLVPTPQAPAPAPAPISAPVPQVNHVQAPALAPRR